jgi:hypothetical protein
MPAVHNVFRSSLASAPQFIGSAIGDDDRRSIIANYYANLMAFLQVHHDGEEHLVFPLIVERAPDGSKIIENAEAQHDAVTNLIAEVNKNVASWESGNDDAIDPLREALLALDAQLRPHLDEEEATILPLAGDFLSVEEWGMLPGHAMMNFQGDKIWLILGLIRENFTETQRDMMLSHMPPPARQMWETVGESSFNDLIGQVRQTI